MGGGSRLDDEGLGITDVGKVRSELAAVDKGVASLETALDAESEDGTEATLEVLLRELVAGVVRKTSVADPGDLGPRLEPLRELEGVLAVASRTERQGLDTLDEEPRAERAEKNDG